ncbi:MULTISPECIES: GntR family transcriptional regulator [Bradyrhizobium]|uniref:Transcriptional regulator, GntR family n=2 Tax=Bradyrhizobium TaxID=374 RepID=A0ABY0PE54_9BRAD|nr:MULTISPECIES: GntR family transcriptional regulator [Bradyrhizobium]SDI19592.1 transcriptional regulator, GntR family [Bradyrhizobium ottawaense]SED74884.1 transcriptional regulator, GntR family [Bradyrhizobium lablabi]SHL70500.1 transcriptional regulator, GntR family [Bradyrhizobium lablabi]
MTAVSIDRSPQASGTRYAELANALVKEIAAGRYVVGSLLPTEHELADYHGVSRHTVRAALRLLQDLGYVSRRKSVGTIVENVHPNASYTQSFSTVEDLVRVAATEVRSIEDVRPITLDRSTARRLEAPVGSQWILVSATRVDVRRNRAPVAWADIYIDAPFARITDDIRNHPDVLISSLIEREFGIAIAEIRQVVSGMLIEAPLANVLRVEPGSAGLRLVRQYKSAGGRILEITDTRYPADRVSVSFQLKRVKAP